jgi:hypothetical protein
MAKPLQFNPRWPALTGMEPVERAALLDERDRQLEDAIARLVVEYLPSATASLTYLRLTGGSLSGPLNLATGAANGLKWPTHGGTIWMQDTSWVRFDKGIWAAGNTIGTDGDLTVGYGGTVSASWKARINGNFLANGMVYAEAQVFARAPLSTGGVGGNYTQAQVRAEESVGVAGGQCAISFHNPGNGVAPQLRNYGPFGNRLDCIDAFNTGYGSFAAAAFTVISSERFKDDIEAPTDTDLLELAKQVKGARFRNNTRPQVIETTERFRDVNRRWVSSGRTPLRPTERHLTGSCCDHICGDGYCTGTPEQPCAVVANDTHRYGLIAEELFTVMPEAVNLDPDGKPESYNVDQVAAMALAAVAALARRLDTLEDRHG